MSFINTNLNSLAAQRQLSLNANGLAASMQRLSSGLRINSARDDAAGLAIVERFTTQIKGTDQAARNTNDAISLAQTAEGALGSISNNLQRIRELAVQAANSTNSASDRAALQAEAAQLFTENDRIASQTEFNGTKLLDGTFNGQQFQVGANRAQTVAMSGFGNMSSATLGTFNGFSGLAGTMGVTIGAPSPLSVTLNGTGTTVSLGVVNTESSSIVNAINNSGIVGLTATASNLFSTSSQVDFGTASGTAVLTLNGVNINLNYQVGALNANRTMAVAAINAQSAATGVIAQDVGNGLKIHTVGGRNLVLAYNAGTATGTDNWSFGLPLPGPHAPGLVVSYQAPTGIAVSSVTVAGAGLSGTPVAVSSSGTAVSALDISTVAGANAALDSLDAALNTVNAARANMGAAQNRFQSAIANLQTNSENMNAARGRIQDADFAQETANLSRAQILQQASTAMVAQANQSPQGVLALLK